MSQSNYYKIIGVNPNASEEEIQSAFKALFARYNPSSNPNSMYLKTMFQQLNEAYEVLGDKVKREAYNVSMGFDVPRFSTEANVVTSSITENAQSQESIMPPPLPQTDEMTTSQQTEGIVPLSQVERVEVRRESVIHEKARSNGGNENMAYVFLFILIGVILIGGGVFAYFEFSDSEKVNEVEEVIEVEPVSSVKQDKKREVEPVKKENLEKEKGEIKVGESKAKTTEGKVEEEVKQKPEPSKATDPAVNKKQNNPVKDDDMRSKIEEKKGINPVASKSNEVKEGLGTKKAFRVGASKTDVWAVKGDPTDITTNGNLEIWHYGKTKIKFRDGKVVD
jgi:curved DNA-binding protein CbpA